MLTIDLTGINGSEKNIADIIREHDSDISREIILSICDAIYTGAPRVIAIQIIKDSEVIDFTITKNFYASALEKCIPTLVITEEYEVCAMAKKYIEIISQKYLEFSK